MAYKRTFSNRAGAGGVSSGSGDEVVIELDKKKQVTIRKFNNINLVDIREFYIDKDSGEKKPGKKGISLTEDTWYKLLDSTNKIQSALDILNGGSSGSAPSPKKTKVDKKTDKKEKAEHKDETEEKKAAKIEEEEHISDADE
ncbi:predicted protein [Scheffersomyces stipitis CBS 6054]|uniref:Transcriptional coactivator p15 (PC4) C-terminal domain-containing protein n=1 Tax=Scheffersomyces stipitis (strain ATCC 58785 / CBS 6054 / NBRC 10063 / NRRL Y-11545) TaxID=322104 RepID=A3LSR4_PICST|nr:predicted protein [Scheffersomyces stipitis CBS 6054]ABN66279.2 predicted protein [Scheffersomyces stipitis CBS 6054]KAG2733198.1 hypothetical protein G9P44_004188 [Scheffersomyces stipitis]